MKVAVLKGGRSLERGVSLRSGARVEAALEVGEVRGSAFPGRSGAACVRCIDKSLTKHDLRAAGIPTPDWFAFNETAFRELGAADALSGLEERLRFPLVIKPSRGGSALGVKFAESRADVPAALVSAFSY